ncbi:MAG: FAD-binding protein [Candidatus Paceibacterota bacterium]
MATLVERDVPLAPLTTLKVGGKAAHFVVVRDLDSLREALAYATEQMLPVITLGGGSNVLIADRGLSGLVIKNEITGIDVKVVGETVHVRAGAGEELDAVIKQLTEAGYWGLENLSGIPGTVGGAVVQNANAYGVTIGDIVSAVETVCLSDGTQQNFTQRECAFEYRNSRFKAPNGHGQYLITHVNLELSTTPVTALSYQSASQSMAKCLVQRGITTYSGGYTYGGARD